MTSLRELNPAARVALAVAGGPVLTLTAWFVLLPTDLSELPGGGGGDDYAPLIALVLGIVLIVALALVRRAPSPFASVLTGAGALTWVVLFAYFASTSEVSGANLWMVPFIMMVMPAAVVATVVVRSVERGRARTNR